VGSTNGQTSYSYAPDQQLLNVERADGQTVGFVYDSAGRRSVIDLASGDIGYSYDAVGRVGSLSTPQVNLAFSYDGRLPTLSSWSGAISGSVAQTFDNDFRLSSISVNGSNPIALQYDADGQKTLVGALSLTHDPQSGLVTSTALGSATDTTTYDGFGAPQTYSASYAASPLYAASDGRDALGRLTSASETIGGTTRTTTYVYDDAGRLKDVVLNGTVQASYTYDLNGNRLSRTDASGAVGGTYDARDRLTQYGGTSFTYSASGHRLTSTTAGQVTTYQYDGRDNLIGATLSGGVQVDYVVDGRGRRVGKRVNGALTQAFLYQDGLRPVAELNAAGGVVGRFVYAGATSLPAYLIKNGATYRIVADQIGNPRLVVDVATGQIAQRMDFDEFGNVALDTNPGFQPFGFAGGLLDQHTGLVHFGAREYDPATGRWLTPDPIGFGGGDANLYAYVENDPVNLGDPTGLSPWQYYDTEQEAAFAALSEVWALTWLKGIEYGGYIYKAPNGKFFYQTPIEGNDRAVRLKNVCPSKYGVPVADYHTHPHIPDNNDFSDLDIKNITDEDTVGYLGAPNFKVKRYNGKKVDYEELGYLISPKPFFIDWFINPRVL
jgi:RHS repeat-associated protein